MPTMTATQLRFDYFQMYDVVDRLVEGQVSLHGQFDQRPQRMNVTALEFFANPVSKNGEPLHDRNAHLTWYRGTHPQEPMRIVKLENQFGRVQIRTGRAVALLVPTQKKEPRSVFPETLDHYKVYALVYGQEHIPYDTDVGLKLRDQFGASQPRLRQPMYLAVPVRKRHGRPPAKDIRNERGHLLLYGITPREISKRINLLNQFAPRGMAATVVRSVGLAVPSIKLDVRLA